MEKTLIWVIGLLLGLSIIVGSFLIIGDHKREKVASCIEQTQREMYCRCTYFLCESSILGELDLTK